MKRVLRSLALVAIAVASFTAAQAQNPHFKKNEDPIPMIQKGRPVEFYLSGTLYGCGNSTGVELTLTSDWTFAYDCVKMTKNGIEKTPGIFKGITASVTTTGVFTPQRNGRVDFNIKNEVEVYASSAKYGWAQSGKFCPALTSLNSPWDIEIDYDKSTLNSYSISGLGNKWNWNY